MSKRIKHSTPKQDGFRMPGEFEPQEKVWMIWPERPDNWRDGGKPAQEGFMNVAKAISQFTPMNVIASQQQFENARYQLPPEITVYEMSNNDAWVRDCGPSFLIDDKGNLRATDWEFNAWGSLVDGLYFPWDQDDLIAQKICEVEGVDSYRTNGFVLEGGSIHVDGEGTVLTTEMCLLSEGRNPDFNKEEIEKKLCEYLNVEKVLWLKDGIDPEETNGHVDDVACFVRPGEVACIYTDDKDSPFYEAAQDAYKRLSEMTDAKGRKLKVHKIACPVTNVTIKGDFKIDSVEGTLPREEGDICIASYMNFLITNDGVIVPQYGDENDTLAIQQIQEIFPNKEVVGVDTVEIVYGGGNIHCITQQQPKA
ncbi:agmatine deiminase [Tetragenococcus koreensis]|uniref:Putative agmatine deiminase n=1 Tax=Tetragenococcus koreensis TaxID=290335 RepID=A0AAN4RLU3_9ENTE|nr:agmatine deiminase [Tetragenococcus koreensis]MCF1615455.1 agmatine deiminase [Tetragenococcus koreensis]MCF1625251.1 agmatine deiminase [Tetragenococcus koreensis]MCF1627949.1 agmatine deiminase [Tetragenococcus koreensis]MCF1678925.1 agmatine deiminase [Tetragenococcus koreensis]GEQ49177.1 agmatine deiminase [Tetragenococcus koreensis]